MINELTSEILFRCPNCQKLYQTDRQDIVGNNSAENQQESKIEFQCQTCNSDFYLNDEITSLGLYHTEKKVIHEFVHCPKCNALKSKNQDECATCGVFESKFLEINKLESPRLYELNNLWNQVVGDFDNDIVHQDFLNRAQQMSALNFAAQKYLDMEKIIGKNTSCEKYLNQIELRLKSLVSRVSGQSVDSANRSRFNLKNSFFGIEYNSRNLLLLFAFVGILFFLFNVIKPLLPSVNGLILAFIALSIGLWSLSKNQTKEF